MLVSRHLHRLLAFGMTALLALASASAESAVFTVSKIADTNDGVCNADCSLREAITAANALAGSDTINFGVSGTFTVSGSALPIIIGPLAINGTTAPTYTSTPVVRIDGNGLANGNGLHFGATADISSLTAIAITRFPGNGLQIQSDTTSITKCFIGVALDGITDAGNALSGIDVSGASVTIGGLNAGNVISGNTQRGIYATSGANSLIIQDNKIGTNASGTAALPNDGNGIYGSGGSNVFVGGAIAGSGNTISGNGGIGIDLAGSSASWSIYGNMIGVSASGEAALGNVSIGIRVQTSNHSIGSTFATGRNVIAANGNSGITISQSASGVSVFGNHIGTNAATTAVIGSQPVGINVFGSNCTIGGIDSSRRNVISGNTNQGINIYAASSGCVVSANYIGLNASGTAAVGNQPTGILVSGSNCTIGGEDANRRNVIAGYSEFGLNIQASVSNCLFIGNYIGTNAAGTASATTGVGVILNSTNIVLGGSTAVRRNIVSGNPQGGIWLGGTGNMIQGNYIGTNPAGDTALPNGNWGIRVIGASSGTIGGLNAGEGNLISGNTGAGVTLDGDTTSISIVGNTIGLSESGTVLGNGGGVLLNGSNHVLGGSTTAARNVISGNADNGVSVYGTNNSIKGNYIGTNTSGSLARPNGAYGIRVLASTGINIGGLAAGEGNLISGNVREGIVYDGDTSGSFVRGNKIGTNLAGTAAISNDGGISVAGNGHTIGGNTAAARNVISGNSGGGILISGSGHIVAGNYVGVTADGSTAINGNGSYGLRADTLINSTIGGDTAAHGNVFAAHPRGVNLGYGSHDNLVLNNIVGLNATATVDLYDIGTGIEIADSFNNTIGLPGKGNVIAGMAFHGIGIDGIESSGNIIQGNFIGTNKVLAAGLGNSFAGIFVSDSIDNKIGGTGAGEGNVIVNNYQFGVRVDRGDRIEISGNSIFGNFFGIDIDQASFFPNDEGDTDEGANGILNYPLLSSVLINGGATNILGLLINQANTQYRVEFFSSPTCNTSGFGEGKTFRGSTLVTTGGDGHAALNYALGLAVPDAFVTATVTDPLGSTSEFSPCAQVGLGENAGKLQFDRFAYVGYENVLPTTQVIVLRSHGLSGTATVNFTTSDSSALAGSDYTDSDQLLSFAPWEAVKIIEVPILYDPAPELSPAPEKLLLALTGPGGGATLGTTANGEIQIWDYTPADPGITVSDAQLIEGNSGTTMMSFQVRLTATDHQVTVEYLTEPGTALAGEDYVNVEPTQIVFPISANNQTVQVQVPVKGDTTVETNEVFWLRVWGVENGGNWIAYDIYGRGTIINDDGIAPPAENIFKSGFEDPPPP